MHARNGTVDVKRPTANAFGPGEDEKAGRAAGHRRNSRAEQPTCSSTSSRTATTAKTKISGQKLFDEALRLARLAEKTGGPWPVLLLREAAASGYAPALYALATWYLHGRGVKKDYKKAFSLMKESAEQRFAPAEYDLAVSYELGKGVAKSDKSAFLFYCRAGEDGDLDGMTEVARCYWFGIGTSKNYRKAADWYLKAARQGNAESQTTMAKAYESGKGVRRSMRKAIFWYEKAAAQGDEEALRVLQELGSEAVS